MKRNIIRRFLWPVYKNPALYAKWLLVKTIRAAPPVYALIMAEQVTHAIEAGDIKQFWFILAVFAGGIWLLQVLSIFFRNWGRVALNSIANIDVYEDAIKKFLRASNTAVEKIWTGRMIAIVQNGMSTWSRSITDIVHFLPRFVLIFGLTCYLLARSSRWILLLFVGLLTLSYLFSLWVNKRIIKQRNISRDINNERTRKFVKIVMSKFEIVQNNKIAHEVQELKDNTHSYYDSEKQRSLDVEWFFRVPEVSMFLLKFLVYGLVWYGIFRNTFSYADLVVFTGALSLMDRAVTEVIKFVSELTKNFAVIEKLRNTLDELPTLETQRNTMPFVLSKWAISLQGVSFAYEQKNILENLSIDFLPQKKLLWWGHLAEENLLLSKS